MRFKIISDNYAGVSRAVLAQVCGTCYTSSILVLQTKYPSVAQSGLAHAPWERGVEGSNPFTRTKMWAFSSIGRAIENHR